jgi:hypothetical protein
MKGSKRRSNDRRLTPTVSSVGAACLALAVLTVATGCGSKSSSSGKSTSTSTTSSSTASAFVARAIAICTEPQTGPAPAPFPFPSFNPLHPDRSKLPAIGRYFSHTNTPSILRRELARLRALGTPPKDQADWQRLLAAKQSSLAAITRQYQAALASDVPTFISTVRMVTTDQTQERTAASGFGATYCGPPAPGQQVRPPPGRPSGVPPQARVALTELAACMRAKGIAVQANLSGNGPPLTTRIPVTDPRYRAAGDTCRAQLAHRFPFIAQGPTPP